MEPLPARSPAPVRRAVPGGWSTPEPMTPPPPGAAPLPPTPSPVHAPPPPRPQTNGKAKQSSKGKAVEKKMAPQASASHHGEDSQEEHDALARSLPGGFEPLVKDDTQAYDDRDTVPDLPPPVKEKTRKPRKRTSVASAASLGSLEDEPISSRRRSSRLSERKRK
ncbi:hypothetical protein HDZ31DRAFT_36241 [Schizophyllum fasciatum]